MRFGVILLLGVALTGCATKHWTKPGATAQEFHRDSYACGGEARQSRFQIGGAPWALTDDKLVNEGLYRSCMQARGYERNDPKGWEGLRD